jgi:hypothetical protein
MGRFMQQDPLGIRLSQKRTSRIMPTFQYGDGINLYQYGSECPIVSRDPYGLQMTKDECQAVYDERKGRIFDGLGDCLSDCGLSILESWKEIVACSVLAAKCGPYAPWCWGGCIAATGIGGSACGIACAYASGLDLISARDHYQDCMDDAPLYCGE